MANIKLPEIRIKFAYLLYSGESRALEKDWFRSQGKPISSKSGMLSYEQYIKLTEDYRKEWEKYEAKLLKAMCNKLELNFYLPVIDVNLAPYFIAKSEPVIINFRNQPDQFVDVLTHELLHILLTDNDKLSINSKKRPDLLSEWEKLFGKTHDWATLVHIPVHALQEYLYLDVLKESSRYERDKESVKQYSTGKYYTAAWDYVDKHGYEKIIDKLKLMYSEL